VRLVFALCVVWFAKQSLHTVLGEGEEEPALFGGMLTSIDLPDCLSPPHAAFLACTKQHSVPFSSIRIIHPSAHSPSLPSLAHPSSHPLTIPSLLPFRQAKAAKEH
jgi:hypothetical protein